MAINPEQLKVILNQTFSPVENTRKTAESQLEEAVKKVPGYPLTVLQLIATSSSNAAEAAICQAAAIHFKNIIKKGWDTNSEYGTHGIVIPPNDRTTIKTHLVQLMCTVPPQIQAQISAAISLIADVDYPEQWDNLLDELVKQFTSTDQAVVIGVLKTANSILKRYRHVQKSDELFATLLYSLKKIQAPLLALFIETGKAVQAFSNDKSQLLSRFETLRLICRIFYSLNYQDLPEFFEDHMKEWMEEFAKYLKYKNPILVDEDEETEPGPIDKLQSSIIVNLSLYADKDEEPFLPFLPEFTSLIWDLLLTISLHPKHDTLATTSIKFLSSLVQKQMHKTIFDKEQTLKQIVAEIVIKNLVFRESDEELFEDDPREYIITEVEGSDSESRRRCSQDLLRAMCRQFEAQTTTICSEHVGTMLNEFATNPESKWAAKDAAIHLMFGISIRRESNQGVSEINDAVNVMDFFQQHILPELQDTNHASRPVVKATALKFVATFRNQFTKEQLIALLPFVMNHLAAPSVVVHTFAAYVIERILMTKEEVQGVGKRPKITSTDLKPLLDQLFTMLFAIVDNTELNENDHVMKCVMRCLSAANQDVIPVTQAVLEKLTNALGRVAKNPRNPQFNHYVFESIAVLVKSVCSSDPAAAAEFEKLLFPPFQTILQMDILEFTPYVFQILAQLLEIRPTESGGIGEAYSGLFKPLLNPVVWESRGNIPALARLIEAYVYKASNEVVTELLPILGVFQKLLSVAGTVPYAFDLLSSLTLYMPKEAIYQHYGVIFNLILTQLQAATRGTKQQSAKCKRFVSQYFALFTAKYGAQAFIDELNKIQVNMGFNLIGQIWLPRLKADPPTKKADTKVQIIGLSKLLCEIPTVLLGSNDGKTMWGLILEALVTLLTSATFKQQLEQQASASSADGSDDIEIEIGYDATFSGLMFAKKKYINPFPEIATDPTLMFVQSLHSLSSSQPPGHLVPLIQEGLKSDLKLSAALQSMFQKAGLTL